MLIPIVLAGGSGTRLWPLSRRDRPKQFQALAGETSLLRETLARLDGIEGIAAPIVIGREAHRFLLAEQLREAGLTEATLLLEPEGRDTAPAIAAAALVASQQADDPVLLVLPADHLMVDTDAFHASVARAVALAEQELLVTFGIVPTQPETGYGYLKRGEPVGEGFRVERFVEKPDTATARDYLAHGGYLWNGGMFVFRATRYLAELERYQPEILTACRGAVDGARQDLDFLRLESEAFCASPAISIDYAVMEHTDAAALVTLESGWSDIGSWASLWESLPHDADDNVLRGDVILDDSRRNLIHAESRLVATLGVEDLVIVETGDAVLVAQRGHAQSIKPLVARLQSQSRPEADSHLCVHRPWGHYQSLANGPRYQVKRLHLSPGARVSRQLHHHRAEHWVVVCGTARVSVGERSFLLGENESTFIPMGEVHVLENPGLIDLEVIEVQSGAYLGEDDIIRLDDPYGRA